MLALFVGAAAAQSNQPDFSFDGFAGTYYLGRNGQGVATLSSQEDMVVSFPGNTSLTGLTRDLPTSYQGHDLALKVIGVTDAAGNPVPFKTAGAGQDTEAVQIGDPSITVGGEQTYRLKYQNRGVAAFYPTHDEFLIDVNGRGWNESFNSVKAFIHLEPAFSSALIGQPSCYIGYNNLAGTACMVKAQNESGGQLITASTNHSLGPNQALVVKLDFKKGTFVQVKPVKSVWPWLAAGAVLCGLVGLWFLGRFIK